MKCELVSQMRFQDPVLLAKLVNFKVEWSNQWYNFLNYFYGQWIKAPYTW